LRGRVDLIFANPPYVSAAEYVDLDPVLRHEPQGALVAENARGVEGFGDIDIVIREAYEWLAPSGVLVCEHGDAQGRAVLEVANAAGFHFTEDHLDLAGRPRVLVARR
jgi:release factor glutamine methyltransferase